MRYTYEIRWAGVICIQTGLAGALLLSCREPHCSTFKSTTDTQCTPLCNQHLVIKVVNIEKLNCLLQLCRTSRVCDAVESLTISMYLELLSTGTSVYQTSGICHNIYLTNCMALQYILVHPQCLLKCRLHTGCCKHCVKYAWFHV